MSVFISYFRADEQAASAVNSTLKQNNVVTYLDLLDDDLKKAENVTSAILKGLEDCTHLLAIVSRNTQVSWWVPFEIGVATRAQRRISTYALSRILLPDYLKHWPVLYDDTGLLAFIKRYLQDSSTLEKKGRVYEARASAIQSAATFHRLLKTDLGQ